MLSMFVKFILDHNFIICRGIRLLCVELGIPLYCASAYPQLKYTLKFSPEGYFILLMKQVMEKPQAKVILKMVMMLLMASLYHK